MSESRGSPKISTMESRWVAPSIIQFNSGLYLQQHGDIVSVKTSCVHQLLAPFQVRFEPIWYHRVSWACSIFLPDLWVAASDCSQLSLSLKIYPLSPSETTLGFSHRWLGPEILVQERFSTFLPSLTMAEVTGVSLSQENQWFHFPCQSKL